MPYETIQFSREGKERANILVGLAVERALSRHSTRRERPRRLHNSARNVFSRGSQVLGAEQTDYCIKQGGVARYTHPFGSFASYMAQVEFVAVPEDNAEAQALHSELTRIADPKSDPYDFLPDFERPATSAR